MAKILIAEDEKPIAKALSLKLGKSGYEVKAVNNGQEAIDLVEKEDFDLIVLDLMMPKLDGFAFLERARESKLKSPIIVTSNLGQEEDKAKAIALGAKDYLVKSNTSINAVVDRIKKFANP